MAMGLLPLRMASTEAGSINRKIQTVVPSVNSRTRWRTALVPMFDGFLRGDANQIRQNPGQVLVVKLTVQMKSIEPLGELLHDTDQHCGDAGALVERRRMVT
ncbi:hypothetical protein AX760_16995 [Pararhizobium antarcticum]|uniref:Uncharacterized protein n=2 Tax=Pararhizobium antarcticum TaxID=1798805 RepID=A0A657LSN9_9HYPH|nr:hypothetical protein AX760_16995 [Pararhizobium antarcticum]